MAAVNESPETVKSMLPEVKVEETQESVLEASSRTLPKLSPDEVLESIT